MTFVSMLMKNVIIKVGQLDYVADFHLYHLKFQE